MGKERFKNKRSQNMFRVRVVKDLKCLKMSKETYLEACYLMDKNLELAIGRIVNGKKDFKGTWIKYAELKEKGIDLSEYTLRTICLNEVVIEFDNKDGKLTREKAKEWIFEKSKKLEEAGINHTIWDYENSLSPHLHIKGIADLECIEENEIKDEVPKLKKSIAEYFCTEEQRNYLDTSNFGLRTLIAIEETPHWKYGSVKNLIYIFSMGDKNAKLGYFFDLVGFSNYIKELHSNMSNRSNISNQDNEQKKIETHVEQMTYPLDILLKGPMMIRTLNEKLKELNKQQFGVIEPEEVRARDLEWYKSKDFSKGGLKHKPNDKISPYTTLHRGVNVVRFYKKVEEVEIGGQKYYVYEVKAYFMLKLEYEQYGYLAIPKSLENELFNEMVRRGLEGEDKKDIFAVTFVINKYGNNRFPKYEFEILNHAYTEPFVEQLEFLRADNFFETAPMLVPKFRLNKLIRERDNRWKAQTWINKMEAIIRGELKITEHMDMVNITRELLRINISEEEIHKMCQINYGEEYSFKECQEQIESIKKYLTKQKVNNNKFLEEWTKQIVESHHKSD